MLNHVVLVGRIIEQEMREKGLYLTLIVGKPFKNDKGKYESDLVPCLLKGGIATTTQENCSISDVVGIKGSLENKDNELYVLVQKLTFLSSKNKNG